VSAVQLAAVLGGIVLVASIVSVELGVTVALLELTLGVAAGNTFHLDSQDWLDYIAKFASIVLTFLAGMEVDPAFMRRRLGASVGIGVVSFVGPFVVASAVRTDATARLTLSFAAVSRIPRRVPTS
jgi:Kef-type K+ transport system membrane component KefB